MTDDAFIAKYRICSVRGRLYTRRMLIDAITRSRFFRGTPGLTRQHVIDVLDEGTVLASCAGMVPARVIDEVVTAAVVRVYA